MKRNFEGVIVMITPFFILKNLDKVVHYVIITL